MLRVPGGQVRGAGRAPTAPLGGGLLPPAPSCALMSAPACLGAKASVAVRSHLTCLDSDLDPSTPARGSPWSPLTSRPTSVPGPLHGMHLLPVFLQHPPGRSPRPPVMVWTQHGDLGPPSSAAGQLVPCPTSVPLSTFLPLFRSITSFEHAVYLLLTFCPRSGGDIHGQDVASCLPTAPKAPGRSASTQRRVPAEPPQEGPVQAGSGTEAGASPHSTHWGSCPGTVLHSPGDQRARWLRWRDSRSLCIHHSGDWKQSGWPRPPPRSPSGS